MTEKKQSPKQPEKPFSRIEGATFEELLKAVVTPVKKG